MTEDPAVSSAKAKFAAFTKEKAASQKAASAPAKRKLIRQFDGVAKQAGEEGKFDDAGLDVTNDQAFHQEAAKPGVLAPGPAQTGRGAGPINMGDVGPPAGALPEAPVAQANAARGDAEPTSAAASGGGQQLQRGPGGMAQAALPGRGQSLGPTPASVDKVQAMRMQEISGPLPDTANTSETPIPGGSDGFKGTQDGVINGEPTRPRPALPKARENNALSSQAARVEDKDPMDWTPAAISGFTTTESETRERRQARDLRYRDSQVSEEQAREWGSKNWKGSKTAVGAIRSSRQRYGKAAHPYKDLQLFKPAAAPGVPRPTVFNTLPGVFGGSQVIPRRDNPWVDDMEKTVTRNRGGTMHLLDRGVFRRDLRNFQQIPAFARGRIGSGGM
jgi:hypothetical protein